MTESEKRQQRQWEVFQLRRAGQTQAQIAAALDISPSLVSQIDGAIGDAEVLWQRREAEDAPATPSGDPSVDSLERQSRMLEYAQAKMRADSPEFLAYSQQVGWLRLKSGSLRQRLPHAGKGEPSQYLFSSVAGKFKLDVTPFVPSDPEMLQQYLQSGRVKGISCPCGCRGTAYVTLNLHETTHAVNDPEDDADDIAGQCIQ